MPEIRYEIVLNFPGKPRISEYKPADLDDAVQELLGHKNVSATMIYTHALQCGACGVLSPLDRLARKAERQIANRQQSRPAG